MNVALAQLLRKPEPHTLMLLAFSAGSVLIFVKLTDWVLSGGTETVDHYILLSMRESHHGDNPIGPGWFEEMARDFTALGGIPILMMLCAAVSSYLWMDQKPRAALFIIVTALSGLLVSTLLKEVIDRPRPDLVQASTRVYTSSFPSAHAMLSACVYLAFATLLAQAQRLKRQKTAVFLFCSMVIVLVGFSRIYLGVHWPSDVMAGWMAGASWTLICWLVYKRYNAQNPPLESSKNTTQRN